MDLQTHIIRQNNKSFFKYFEFLGGLYQQSRKMNQILAIQLCRDGLSHTKMIKDA